MHVCDTWSFSAISRVVLWRSESIIALIIINFNWNPQLLSCQPNIFFLVTRFFFEHLSHRNFSIDIQFSLSRERIRRIPERDLIPIVPWEDSCFPKSPSNISLRVWLVHGRIHLHRRLTRLISSWRFLQSKRVPSINCSTHWRSFVNHACRYTVICSVGLNEWIDLTVGSSLTDGRACTGSV